MALTGIQPVMAATIQYQIPLHGQSRPKPPVTPAPGTGLGDIDPGANPEEEGAPSLAFATSALRFNITGGARRAQSTFLANSGSAPAVLTGLESSEAFTVSSDCPSRLPAGDYCQVTATPTTAAVAGSSIQLMASAPGAEAPARLRLDAVESPPDIKAPRIEVLPDTVYLGSLKPGESSALGTARLTNVGTAPASIQGIESGSDFTVSSDCQESLEPGDSCTVSATLQAYVPKTHFKTLVLRSPGTEEYTLLTYYGVVKSDPSMTPALSFNTPNLDFSPLSAGTSETLKAVLTNSGTAPAVLEKFASTADFSVSSSCPDLLQHGSSCDVFVTFNAMKAGTKPAFELIARAQDNVRTGLIAQGYVTGTSDPKLNPLLVFAPVDLSFGKVAVGQSRSLQAVVTNKGAVAAAIGKVAVEFAPEAFTQTNDCGTQLAPEASCTVSVSFKPTKAETLGARVVITAQNGEAVLPLSGTGQKAQLVVRPLTVDFGAVALPGTSSAQTVSLGNPGNVPLTGLAVVNSDNRLTVDFGTCTSSLQAETGCALSVRYAPAADGPFKTSFQITSANGGNSTIEIVGTAVRATAAPSTIKFPGTPVSRAAPDQVVTLSNTGTKPLPISGIGISRGIDQFAQSNNCGTSLAAGAACTIVLRYLPATEGAYFGELGVASGNLPVARVALEGLGLPRPALTLSPSSVAFPSMNVGKTSELVTLKLSNPTSESVTITGAGMAAGQSEFGQSNNCGNSLAPGASCTVALQWTPTTTNGSNGAWSAVSSLGTVTAYLSGQATEPKAIIEEGGEGGGGGGPGPGPNTPPVADGFVHYTINFLDTEVRSSSAVRNVTFRNRGDGPLTIGGISLVAGLADFNQSNDCAKVLAPGAACTISLLFSPSALGARTGGIALLSDSGNFYFDLTGKGIGAQAKWYADTSFDFGDVLAGASAVRHFTLVNTGGLTARELAIAVSGSGLSLDSNTCGTTLAANGSCRVSVRYAPTAPGSLSEASVSATGRLANSPAAAALTGTASAPNLKFSAGSDGDFGSVSPRANVSRTFGITNDGKYSDTIASIGVQNTSFSITGGTCGAGVSLAAGAQCSVTVTASPTAAGEIRSALKVTGGRGASIELALKASAVQSPYTVSGSPGSDTTATSDFGKMSTSVPSAGTKYFYLRDNSNQATVATSAVRLIGDSSFVLTSIRAVDAAGQATGVCSAGPATSTQVCSTGAPGRAIQVGVKLSPTTAGVKAATLRFEHNGTQGTSDIALQGEYVFEDQGNWSKSLAATTAFTPADLEFGNQTPGAVADKALYIRNTNPSGAQSVAFTITGDTDQFKIMQVYVATSGGSTWSCVPGGDVSADKTSASPCLATDPATGNAYNHIGITIRFAPTRTGNFNVKVTPSSGNGVAVPGPLSLSGSSVRNPTALWASTTNPSEGPSFTERSFGSTTLGSGYVDKTFYVRNIGTHGPQSVGFKLTGDTSEFQIVQSYMATAGGSVWRCEPGGLVAADKLSVSPCTTAEPSVNPYSWVAVIVRYNPTRVGSAQVEISTSTDNGTILPAAPITVSGSSRFDAKGEWGNSPGSTAAPTAADLTFAATAVGASTDKTLYVRNVGTAGAMAAGFTLSGASSQFKIVQTYVNTSGGSTWTCVAGGAISANQQSTAPCQAGEMATNQYSQVAVVVRYTPTGAGPTTVTLTPYSNNGSVMPQPITLTGTTP